MTSHILFPSLEGEKLPATMSRKILTELLREKLGFGGLVITDCLEMDAVAAFYGTENGAVSALSAGADMVLISHSGEKAASAHLALQKALADGAFSQARLEKAYDRILQLKQKFCLPPQGEAGLAENHGKNMSLRREGITLYGGKIPELGTAPFFVGCADFRSGLVSNDGGADTFAGFMQSRFGGEGFVCDKDPSDNQIEEILQKAKGHSSIIACTYNGHLFEGQKSLIRKLGGIGAPMAVFALRNPYDLKYVPEGAAAVAAWDYTPMTLQIISEILEGKISPKGIPPVKLGDAE